MAENSTASVDPRIRRTRQLLQQALAKLLVRKEFDKISIQEIADLATVNRVTFYDHYADKFALLDGMVANRFQELIVQRGIRFDCSTALSGMVLALLDFLASSPNAGCSTQPQMEPHLESAVIRVLRGMLLDGLREHPAPGVSPEMRASTVAWAMYGAVKEALRSEAGTDSGRIVETVVQLIIPLMPAH